MTRSDSWASIAHGETPAGYADRARQRSRSAPDQTPAGGSGQQPDRSDGEAGVCHPPVWPGVHQVGHWTTASTRPSSPRRSTALLDVDADHDPESLRSTTPKLQIASPFIWDESSSARWRGIDDQDRVEVGVRLARALIERIDQIVEGADNAGDRPARPAAGPGGHSRPAARRHPGDAAASRSSRCSTPPCSPTRRASRGSATRS